MRWRVVAQGDSPEPVILSALVELTGLSRGEVLLSLRRGELIAGEKLSENRARSLASRLETEFQLKTRLVPIASVARESDSVTKFTVILTGFNPGSRARLRSKLEKLSGLPPEQVVIWFARIPFILRSGADHETARLIKRKIQAAGGMVELRPESEKEESEKASLRKRRKKTAESRKKGQYGIPESNLIKPPVLPDPSVSDVTEFPDILTFEAPPKSDELPFFAPPKKTSGASPAALLFKPPGESVVPDDPQASTSINNSCNDISREIEKKIREGNSFPVITGKPPLTGSTAYKVFLCCPSVSDREQVARILEKKLRLNSTHANNLIKSCPTWLATFNDPRRLSQWKTELEEVGATISVLVNDQTPKTSSNNKLNSFLEWLAGSSSE